jgi:hypothetical protein
MRAAPHLDETIRRILLEHEEPPPHVPDRIPDDLSAQWQIEMDDEIAAAQAAGLLLTG